MFMDPPWYSAVVMSLSEKENSSSHVTFVLINIDRQINNRTLSQTPANYV